LNAAFGYTAPAWLPGGNLQTIWPATARTPHLPACRRASSANAGPRRTATSSTSTISQPLRRSAAPAQHLVLFHGLEGSSRQPVRASLCQPRRAPRLGLRVPHFPRLLGRTEPGAARLPLG
jgi:predicted alpha/beta-fold hydrolase